MLPSPSVPEAHDHRPASRPWGRPIALTVGALACGWFVLGELRGPAGELGFPLDDGWIHAQFARQIAHGDGLAYNPGVWVTGSTSPLWTALLAVLHLLPGPVVPWAKALGVVLFLIAVDATARLARGMGLGRGWCALAAGMVASSGWLVWSALSGMEVPLFLALSLWGMVFHIRGRRGEGDDATALASVVVLAAAALARPEGFLLLAIALVDQAVRFRRVDTPGGSRLVPTPVAATRLLETVLIATAVLLPTLIFYRAIGGSWTPSTFAVKGAPTGTLVPNGIYLRTAADVLFRSQPVLLLAVLAGGVRTITRLGTPRDAGFVPAAWLFALPLAYSLMSSARGPAPVGNFGRYLFPLLPVVVVLGLAGIAPIASRLPRFGFGRRSLPVQALLAAALLTPQLATLPKLQALHGRTVANVLHSDVAAARWLAPRLDPRALVATQDVGAIKYGLPNDILDLVGLVTPEIVPVIRDENGVYWEQRLLAFLAEARPDIMVFFAESYPMLAELPPGFRRLTQFEVEENRAMAGRRLLVVATPWNRYPLSLEETDPRPATKPRP